MSGLADRIVTFRASLADCGRARLRSGVALALILLLAAPFGDVRAEGGGGGGRDYEPPRSGPSYGGQMPRGQGAMPRPRTEAYRPQPSVRPDSPARLPRDPGRPPRHPGGGGGWGPTAVGVGTGILGGILIDQARRPVYDPYEPYLPHRPRRPVIIDDYEPDEPVLQRPRRPPPVRQAAPPRRSPPPAQTAQPNNSAPQRVVVPDAAERRFVTEEILFELAPNAPADGVLRRYRATQIDSRRFELAGATLIRAQLNDGRSARTVLMQMRGDRQIASAQPNYVYTLQQTDAAPAAAPLPTLKIAPAPTPEVATLGTPPVVAASKRAMQPQYIVEKLHLDDIHKLARGEKIRVAVIDSGATSLIPNCRACRRQL
jgi:hypothetical protein